jgi:hypothetical protein
VLGAADYFNELSAIETARGLDPARLHPYFSQRYYNMLCLAYGSDPSRHQDLVERGRLPQRRAESCRVEYLRAASGWGTVLDAYGR